MKHTRQIELGVFIRTKNPFRIKKMENAELIVRFVLQRTPNQETDLN